MKDSEYAILKLQEIVDDMSQALTGLAKSLNKTQLIIDVIAASKKKDELKEDCEEMSKALDAKQKEYAALLEHRNMLKALIESHKNAKEEEKRIIEETILTIFIAFNVIQDASLDNKKLN